MRNMEVGLAVWLSDYHTSLYVDMCLQEKNLMTPELYSEYREWLKTDEGKRYINWSYSN